MIIAMKKTIIFLFISSLFFSCQNLVYKDKLPQILGIPQIDIESSKQIDEFGGFGEGKTIEIYTLSETTVNNFINQSNKILPNKNNWFKCDWTCNNTDTVYKPIIDLSLKYRGGTEIENYLAIISQLISNPNVFLSFYYNEKEVELSTQAQLMVLNVKTRKLYIIDTIM